MSIFQNEGQRAGITANQLAAALAAATGSPIPILPTASPSRSEVGVPGLVVQN